MRQLTLTTALVAALGLLAGCGRGEHEAAEKAAQNLQAVKVAGEKTTAGQDDKARTVTNTAEVKPLPLRPEKKDRPKPAQTIAVTAEAFHQEIKKDAAAAAKKFEPAWIEVAGVVRSVGSSLHGEPFVTLEVDDPLGVQCLFAGEKQPWAKISKGQKVKLRGLWPEEALTQPQLVDCEIVELGPTTAVELKAETLAEEFTKDKDAARKKYADKAMVVTGFVVDAKQNDLGAVRVFLKGAGEVRVDCGFDAADRGEAQAASSQLGQAIRLVGEFSMIESSQMPALRGCRLIR